MTKRTALILMVFAFFSLVLVLNFKTPMIGEDFGLSIPYFQKAEPLTIKMPILFQRAFDHAMTWNVRIGELLAILFLGFDKAWFNILNTLAFFVFGYLVIVYAKGKFPSWKDPSVYLQMLVLGGLIMLIMPAVGEIFFWLTGSMNYLWSLILLLGFFLPFRFYFSDQDILSAKSKLFRIFFYLVGILAGLSNENTVPVALFWIIGYFVIGAFKQKRVAATAPVWYFIGGGALLLGYLVQIFAPSTLIRRAYYNSAYGVGTISVNLLAHRTISNFVQYWSQSKMLALLALASLLVLVLFAFHIRSRKQSFDHKTPILLICILVSSYLSILILSVVPYFEIRSGLFTYFFLLVYIVYVFDILLNSAFRKPILIAVALFGMFFVLKTGSILGEYEIFNNESLSRHYLILAQVERGAKSVEIQPFETSSSRLITTRDNWLAAYYDSQYPVFYGLDSIKYLEPPK